MPRSVSCRSGTIARSIGGDWRMREVMLGQADLVGEFGMQTREGDSARFADRAHKVPAIGRPITVYGRPRG